MPGPTTTPTAAAKPPRRRPSSSFYHAGGPSRQRPRTRLPAPRKQLSARTRRNAVGTPLSPASFPFIESSCSIPKFRETFQKLSRAPTHGNPEFPNFPKKSPGPKDPWGLSPRGMGQSACELWEPLLTGSAPSPTPAPNGEVGGVVTQTSLVLESHAHVKRGWGFQRPNRSIQSKEGDLPSPPSKQGAEVCSHHRFFQD